MYWWVCLVALLAGSHASGRDCPSYFNPCIAKGKGITQRGKGESYQQCVDTKRREFGTGAKCVSEGAEKAISEKACSCGSTTLSVYTAYPSLVEPISQVYCADPADMIAPSCDRSVLQCYLKLTTFIQSILPTNGDRSPGSIENFLFTKCSADQSGKLDELKSCITDLKNKDLSGCGVLNYFVPKLHSIAVDALKYLCTGCNMVTISKSCVPDLRSYLSSPSALCNLYSKEKLDEVAKCMQNQMDQNSDCANLNYADSVKVLRDSSLYALKDKVCGSMEKVIAEYKTWGCPPMAKGKGPYGKGKGKGPYGKRHTPTRETRELEEEYNWNDLMKEFIN